MKIDCGECLPPAGAGESNPSQPLYGILEMISDGVVRVDANGCVVFCNSAAMRLLGLPGDYSGLRLSDLVDRIPRRVHAGSVSHQTIAKAVLTDEVLLLRSNGVDEDGTWTMTMQTLASAPAERLISFATRHPVTALLNRPAFEERLAQAIGTHEHNPLVVMTISIDRFRGYVEAHGRLIADTLLRAFARRLKKSISDPCELGHMFGGNFALFFTSDVQDVITRINQEITSILDGLEAPLDLGCCVSPCAASVGYAVYPYDGITTDALLGASEIANFAAQNRGGNRAVAFEQSMLESSRRQWELERELRVALEGGQLELVFQPKVHCDGRRLSGVEALMRWRHPEKGYISPAEFIPLAERTGIIVPLGKWVMYEACRQIAAWRDEGLMAPKVAVNVSPVQLLDEPIGELLAPLAEFSIPNELIELEVTESGMMDALQQSDELLHKLNECKLSVAMDDFGTGHSSIANLRKLPITVFKIDKSLIEDIAHSKEARDIAATVVAMARALSLQVIAEGIETEAQAEVVSQLGVDCMQGYLFARPGSAETIRRWL